MLIAKTGIAAFCIIPACFGIFAFWKISQAETEWKKMEVAIASGTALKTKAVIVDTWDRTTSGRTGKKTDYYVKLKGDGVDLVRLLASPPDSRAKVGSQVTVYAFEGRYYVQGIDHFGGHNIGKWVFLLLFCLPPVVFLGFKLRSSLQKPPH